MFNTVEQYDRVVLFSGDGFFEQSNYYAQRTLVSEEMVARNCAMLLIDILI